MIKKTHFVKSLPSSIVTPANYIQNKWSILRKHECDWNDLCPIPGCKKAWINGVNCEKEHKNIVQCVKEERCVDEIRKTLANTNTHACARVPRFMATRSTFLQSGLARELNPSFWSKLAAAMHVARLSNASLACKLGTPPESESF